MTNKVRNFAPTGAKIAAVGSYLPKKILTNADLEKLVDTTDEWITERSGIKQRAIAAADELTSDLAVKAALAAFSKTEITADQIELIIVATATPDYTFPATAMAVQAKLKATKAFAFDVSAVCSGFIYALNIANNFIKTGQVKNALVIGAETFSRIIDWKDRTTCVLFGDGAGAVLLTEADETSGILACDLHSDGSLQHILKASGGPSSTQTAGYILMSGKEVFKHAIEKMSSSVLKILDDINLTVHDIDWLVPHQANSRILASVAKHLEIPLDKVVITIEKHGNTSAASIPLALDSACHKFKKGDLVILEALGAGLTWGAVALRW